MLDVVEAPKTVCLIPTFLRNSRLAIDRIPVWRVVLFQFLQAPSQANLPEHRQVCLSIRVIGIQQRAIPIEQDTGETIFFGHSWEGSRIAAWIVHRREAAEMK